MQVKITILCMYLHGELVVESNVNCPHAALIYMEKTCGKKI